MGGRQPLHSSHHFTRGFAGDKALYTGSIDMGAACEGSELLFIQRVTLISLAGRKKTSGVPYY